MRRDHVSLIALAPALALALHATAARADVVNPYLEQARKQKHALAYDDAAASLERALAWGQNRPGQLALIYRLEGEIHAGLGDSARAIAAFRRWLALEPTAELPPGTSPKIAGPFADARAFFDDRQPLRAEQRIEPGTPPTAAVTVSSDPLSMVSGIRVSYLVPASRWLTTEARGSGTIRVRLPDAATISVVIEVIDSRGNALIAFGSREEPLVAASGVTSDRPPPPPGDGPLIARWWLWGGVAVAFGGAAGYFAYDTRDAQNELDDIYAGSPDTEFDDVADRIDQLETRGERSALLANIGFGVAGTAAIAATVFLIRDLTSSPSVEPTRNGALLTWSF